VGDGHPNNKKGAASRRGGLEASVSQVLQNFFWTETMVFTVVLGQGGGAKLIGGVCFTGLAKFLLDRDNVLKHSFGTRRRERS